jgi:hypothetical protein
LFLCQRFHAHDPLTEDSTPFPTPNQATGNIRIDSHKMLPKGVEREDR